MTTPVERTLAQAALGEIPVITSNLAQDGVFYFITNGLSLDTGTLVMGTRNWTEEERLDELAKRIVRNGMTDVLEWCGKKVGPGVEDPYPYVTTAEMMAKWSIR